MGSACRLCGLPHDVYARCARAATVVGYDEALVGNIVAERYRIGEVIGVGTTGTVFATEHVTFARPAAMKVLRPRFADPDLVSRVFHGEARAAWSVSHPCLCEVFDIGTLPDGSPFLMMERLEGETLANRIARERLSLAAAVDVMMQLLSAIACIHARDLLLRDLRPQNVYLAHRRGCRPLVKILDFGLARLTPLTRVQEEWDALHLAAGAADGVGSTAVPFYLSPERAYGEHGVQPASDLFVAATIFYEMVAGSRPFNGSTWHEVVRQITHGSPPPLEDHRPEVTPELSAFVARALAADPRIRPSSAKEMQDELRAIFEGTRKRSTSTSVAFGTDFRSSGEYSTTYVSPPQRPDAPSTSARERSVQDPHDAHGMGTRPLPTSDDRDDRTLPPFPDAGFDIDVTFDERTTHAHRSADPDDDEADDAETETSRLSPNFLAQNDPLQTPVAPFPVLPAAAKPPPRRR